MNLDLFRFFIPGYENDDAGNTPDGDDAGNTPDETGDENAGGNKVEPKTTFSQEDINKAVAKERRKMQDKNEKLAKELEASNKGRQMTAEEKENLEKQVEELRTAHLTAEEKAKRERARLEKESKEREDTLTKDRDTWKQRFHNSTISRAIVDAAQTHDAFNGEQIAALLQPHTHLAEGTDADGKGNGKFVARVKLPTLNSDGVVVDLDLTVDEAVKHMKDDVDRYGNLFKGNAKSGLGTGNDTTTKVGNIDIAKLSPEEYRKHRDAIKAAASRK